MASSAGAKSSSAAAEKPALLTPTTSRRQRISKPIFAILALLSLAAFSLYVYRNNGFFLPKRTAPNPWDDNPEFPLPEWPDIDFPEPEEPGKYEPLKRYSLEYDKVACWEGNGVWIKHLTPVEMAALGVNRFKDTERASSQADEDAFCAGLRRYGASFWELPPQWGNGRCDIDLCTKPVRKVNVEVGFPTTGGVWILDTSEGWEELRPKSQGLFNALTMDERCKVLEELGGTFCQDIQACPEMDTLLEGVQAIVRDDD